MLVPLTRAGFRAAIVEAEAIELGHAGGQCIKVRELEQRFLRFEATGDDQEMMVDDIELVEQGDMSVREIGHKEVGVVRKERVHRAARPLPDLARLPGFLLARETGHLADEKAYAALFEHRLHRLDWPQCTTTQRVLGLTQDSRPQRAGLQT